MSAWHKGPLVAFDTETTGVDPTNDRIVTATVLVIGAQPGQIIERSWLLDPGVEIPTAASDIHGITTEKARAEGRQPVDVLPEIVIALSEAWTNRWPVVAYNAPFDLTILDHELARHGLGSIAEEGGPGLVIDPLVCDRRLDMFRKGKRTLTATCEHYGVRLDGAHDAKHDAIAAARVAWRLAEKYPNVLQERPLEQLQDDQARWYAEWAAHFEDYLRTRGGNPDAVIERAWPYRPAAVGVPA